MIKFYGYAKCSTCRKAAKSLSSHGVEFKDIDIVDNPPSKAELKKALACEDIELKNLLNTSGVLYREMDMKSKLPHMKQAEVIDLLAKHGKLVKRPFVIDGDQVTLGFKEPNFSKTWY